MLLYISTTVTLVILLDVLPGMQLWALAILPIVSVVAYLALSLFAEFEYMEGEKEAQKQQRRAGTVPKSAKPVMAQRGTYQQFAEMLAGRNGRGAMSASEIQETFNVPRRTAYNWLEKARGQ